MKWEKSDMTEFCILFCCFCLFQFILFALYAP